MASLYVKYPKTCRNKKSSVCLTLPAASLTSSSTGSLSSSDGIKTASTSPTIAQSKRKHHIFYHHAHIRNHIKASTTLPKRKKLKLKKSPPTSTTSTSSDSDTTTQKLDDCRAFIINSNNNIQDEINRNCLYSTCKKISKNLF